MRLNEIFTDDDKRKNKKKAEKFAKEVQGRLHKKDQTESNPFAYDHSGGSFSDDRGNIREK